MELYSPYGIVNTPELALWRLQKTEDIKGLVRKQKPVSVVCDSKALLVILGAAETVLHCCHLDELSSKIISNSFMYICFLAASQRLSFSLTVAFRGILPFRAAFCAASKVQCSVHLVCHASGSVILHLNDQLPLLFQLL